MIQPSELRLDLPVELSNGVMSTTANVWKVLKAAKDGNLEEIKRLERLCHELINAQYNYTPPVYFAVVEGHRDLVKYFLEHGAHDPDYKIYPFQESLQTLARDRGFNDIADMLDEYAANPSKQKFEGDNGGIHYPRTELQKEFERVVDQENLKRTEEILKAHPEFATDETFFWSEGILLFAAKENNRAMIDLLMRYGAKVPKILKWAQFYYLEHSDGAAYMLEKGMDANIMSWQRVTLLHDMAQKGNIAMTELLLKHGAYIDPIDEVYQSTPLGMAARWGNTEMVKHLIQRGADPSKSGASWSKPIVWAKTKGLREIENILTNARG